MTSQKKILIVEDEASIREVLVFNLELENYLVKAFDTAKGVEQLLISEHFDLAIFDVMLPFKSGIDLCIAIRKKNPTLPIIMISAKGMKQDIIIGLKAGADDYLVKPFDLDELLIKVHNSIAKWNRITFDTNVSAFSIGETRIDLSSFKVIRNNIEEFLNAKEQAILSFLYQKKGKVVNRLELLDAIWGKDTEVTTRTIDNFILSIRKKIGDNSKNPMYIKTIRGVGYQLVV